MYTFLLPDAGEGTHESQIVSWHFQEGDEVKEFDVLFEMESDKATVDIPSPVSGKIVKIYVAEGEVGIVGKPVVDIATGEDDDSAAADADQVSGRDADVSAAASVKASFPADGQDAPLRQAGEPEAGGDVDVRTLAVPRVRVFARRNGVDLTRVKGTGSHGKITMEDVESFLADGGEDVQAPPAEPAVSAAGAPNVDGAVSPSQSSLARSSEARECSSESKTCVRDAKQVSAVRSGASGVRAERREPLTSMRRATNRALVASYTQAPHVTIMDRVDCSLLVEHRAQLKDRAAQREAKLTYTAYLVKAAVAMLKAHPELNARIDADADEMVYFDDINIGVAMDTPGGLVVPVLRDANHLSLFDVARAISADAQAARDGKLSAADMKGGSLTITNVGGYATGGVWSTPIINSAESVIIGIGRIEEEFMPDEERQPVLKPMMKISFTFDHRVVDGVAAQLALNDFKAFVADPNLMLAEG